MGEAALEREQAVKWRAERAKVARRISEEKAEKFKIALVISWVMFGVLLILSTRFGDIRSKQRCLLGWVGYEHSKPDLYYYIGNHLYYNGTIFFFNFFFYCKYKNLWYVWHCTSIICCECSTLFKMDLQTMGILIVIILFVIHQSGPLIVLTLKLWHIKSIIVHNTHISCSY